MHTIRRGVRGCKEQGCTICKYHITQAAKFCILMPDICGSSVCDLLHVTLLVPKILRHLLDFWKICALLVKRNSIIETLNQDRYKISYTSSALHQKSKWTRRGPCGQHIASYRIGRLQAQFDIKTSQLERVHALRALKNDFYSITCECCKVYVG
jgi:hypothetical protein